jgi:hypothetical protein
MNMMNSDTIDLKNFWVFFLENLILIYVDFWKNSVILEKGWRMVVFYLLEMRWRELGEEEVQFDVLFELCVFEKVIVHFTQDSDIMLIVKNKFSNK